MFETGTCVIIRYSNGAVYQVCYIEDSRLRWQCLEGADKGRQAEEVYSKKEIAPGIWQVNWSETDGIVVVQVVQPEKNAMSTTIVIPGEAVQSPLVLILDGSIHIQEPA